VTVGTKSHLAGRSRTTGEEEEQTAPHGRRRQPAHRLRRRYLRRLVGGAVVAVLSALVATVAAVAVTPSTSDAPARVKAILAEHGSPSDNGVVPVRVGEAVLATEDSRFYSDPALDPQGTLRAAWGLVTANPNLGGATIEVQLAKLLYTPGRSNPAALAEQVVLAFKLDHDFTKTQILAMYLDAAYFGDGAYGVTEAALHYFGREPSQLSWGQAALIAGLLQAPSAYDPRDHLSAALTRRSHVFARLVAVGRLSPAQARADESAPLDPAIPFGG